jgi:drug/metabolite transporter (DMT)-like permease
VVVPFQYTWLLWGGVFGYAVFGEKPAPTTLIGGAIIVAAGIYIFFREAKRKGSEEPLPPPA